MKKYFGKVAVVIAIVALIVIAGNYVLNAGCSAHHPCGAWCQTFGNCGGNETCTVHANKVTCSCGSNLSMGFPCP